MLRIACKKPAKAREAVSMASLSTRTSRHELLLNEDIVMSQRGILLPHISFPFLFEMRGIASRDAWVGLCWFFISLSTQSHITTPRTPPSYPHTANLTTYPNTVLLNSSSPGSFSNITFSIFSSNTFSTVKPASLTKSKNAISFS